MRWLCLLLLVGCAQEHAVEISIVLPSGAPASGLEYRVVVGGTREACSETPPPSDRLASFTDASGERRVGQLDEGQTQFWVEAWDATCSSCFRGCQSIEVGQDESVTIEVMSVACASTACTLLVDAGLDTPDADAPDADAGMADADASSSDADTGTLDTGMDGTMDSGVPTGLAIDIAAGNDHTCAIRSDGAIFCWGANGSLQCGSSTASELHLPTELLLADDAVQLGLGEVHSCARMTTGEVLCWGSGGGADQRLGYDERTTTATPMPVVGLTANAVDLAVGWWYSCVALEDDTVRCWGQNASGELGSCCTEQPTSIVVPGVSSAAVAAGNGPACAIRTDGVLICWGYNPTTGRLGTGVTETTAAPMPVRRSDMDFGSITQVDSGGLTLLGTADSGFGGHICALSDGRLYCWGRNDEGQVGNGGTSASGVSAPVEVPVTALRGATDFSLGGFHTCAVSTEQVYCWGRNTDGQLGDGTTDARTSPVMSAPSLRVRQVAAGGSHTCVIDVDGRIWCWGDDTSGQLGSAEVSSGSAEPVQVVLPTI